jgi:hypothetical protein
MAMQQGEATRQRRRPAAPDARPRPADLRCAAFLRYRPAPLDPIESALRRLDYLAWRLGQRGWPAAR